jgi:hypothetical protein
MGCFEYSDISNVFWTIYLILQVLLRVKFNHVTSVNQKWTPHTHTHLSALCTVSIYGINLTLSVSAFGNHNLSSNVNIATNVGSTSRTAVWHAVLCIENWENFMFDHGVWFLWNDGLHLNCEIGHVCLNLIQSIPWKRPKEDIFCHQALKKQQKRISRKTQNVLVLISYSFLQLKN